MGTKAIDPQSIRNVTIIGDPNETACVAHRLHRDSGDRGTIRWPADQAEYTIRITELSSRTPNAELERSIRVADGLIAVVNAATRRDPRLETVLRIADDHQVARLCLINGLDQPGADFDRWVHTIADIHGATPLALHVPLGVGAEFQDIIDLFPMWADSTEIPAEQLHRRIRRRTRIGDVVPILCDAPGNAPLLDAIVRYLPSPMDVCQPEHALDY
ncbi:GTP-binding protein [Nocardia sp. NPDC056000]|uniref:GTP-binding protein n=1 Tax=Nocardia sp. NPDC056000 TaxID=3345674 RepID=UPI0035D94751